MASNEHLCLIKSHIPHEHDNLCLINTMFEDLILAFYSLIMIIQMHWFFANAIAYSMLDVSHAEHKHWLLWPLFYVDTTMNRNIPPKNCVLFVPLYALETNMNQTHHQPLSPCCLFSFDFVSKRRIGLCNTAFCVHYRSVSARIK